MRLKGIRLRRCITAIHSLNRKRIGEASISPETFFVYLPHPPGRETMEDLPAWSMLPEAYEELPISPEIAREDEGGYAPLSDEDLFLF